MPYSYSEYKQYIRAHFLKNIKKDTKILDVGPGDGAYSIYLRDIGYKIDCIEIWEPYVQKFDLVNKYDNVIIDDIRDIDISSYDYIIMGDVLENESVVVATMQIDNSVSQIPFYKIRDESTNMDFIYVTGSHMVHDKENDKFVRVEDYKHAYVTDEKHNWFSCLITSDHKIQIGETLFWDWEDYYCN